MTAAPAPTGPPPSAIAALLGQAVARGASDVHLRAGDPPVLRIDGRLQALATQPAVDLDALVAWLQPDPRVTLDRGRSVDVSLELEGMGRFRLNLYRTSGRLAAAIRVPSRDAPALGELNFPVPLADLVAAPHGLVIVCGPTGSGKSATLAALAREVVRRRAALIITLEDPIEYRIACDGGGLVRQRQIGSDVSDFPTALRDALREDPDVLLIGEMRDPETISLALTAAETGHLVLASLHSSTTTSAIERIVDAYAPERQQQIRVQIADSLRAVIAQRLLPRTRGPGRLPAVEILRNNHGVASLIREGKTAQLTTVLQSSRKEGMLQLERCLADLVRAGLVTREAATAVANDAASLASYLQS
jgi:twitching motility protein PilT